MAEQDRYESHLGVDTDKIPKPSGSGAEQDRFGRWFGRNKADKVQDAVEKTFAKESGAEVDRYGRWFGGDKIDRVQSHLPKESGAEVDRYSRWFGGDKADQAIDAAKRVKGSGAEVDRYGRYFGGDKVDQALDKARNFRGQGAEQERYGGWFGGNKADQVQKAVENNIPRGSGAEQDRYGSHFLGTGTAATTSTLGLLQHAVLPSFGFHAGLGAIAFGVGRYTDHADAKDWLWPSGQVANAWWSAIGSRVLYDGISASTAWSSLSYSEKLLLTGVTAWGGRLFYRVATRSARRGDDHRYRSAKKQPGFWNKAALTLFLPEIIAQTLISLPFTLPFRASLATVQSAPTPELSNFFGGVAVFLFSAGYALEILADFQLESHARQNSTQLKRDGVWSIVRHPNYLGDALCHLSFPVLLYSSGLLHPLAAVGPVVNYLFLRFVGGDKENEADQEARYEKENPVKYQQLQEYKQTKNSFWPSVSEASNKWLWAVVAAGAGGVVLEQAVYGYFNA